MTKLCNESYFESATKDSFPCHKLETFER